MYLSQLTIKNFRSIKDLTIDFEKDLNVFVGKNNTGKSTIIDAIRLALSTYVNNPNPIRITEDDFYKATSESKRAESFTIKMTFDGLSENQRTKFFEIVDFDLTNMENSVAKLEYTASWPLKNGSRVSVKRSGGPESPEKTEVPQKIMEQFSVIYLPALRDAETALTAGNKSQLATLLKNVSKEESQQFIEEQHSEFNKKISEEKFIKDVVDGINSITKEVADIDSQNSRIVAADTDFLKILRTLQVQMDGNPVNDLSANGLGSNNLLYVAVVLQYLKTLQNDECAILLIEEPEAHLHPQMVLSLSQYLSNNLPVDSKPQTIITTHSPTLVTDIPIDKMHILFKTGDVHCSALKNAGFTDSEKRQFSRLMDITRSTLYFAKGIILVEGISEAILIPVLAQRMGIDLRKKQISVIPICGVSFEIFQKLFNKDVFNIPVAIITDGDPQVTYPSKTTSDKKDNKSSEKGKNWQEAYVDWDSLGDKNVCDRTQKLLNTFDQIDNVFVRHSTITLEYDLAKASDDNSLTMAKAWEKCFSGQAHTLTEDIIQQLPSLEEKAKRIWRVICLSGNSHGKGDFASNLASVLEEIDVNGRFVNKFEVPVYIFRAINFVNNGIKKCQDQAQNSNE